MATTTNLPVLVKMPVSHRPGSLRQENKKHKGIGHQSKRGTKSSLGAGRVGSQRSGPKCKTSVSSKQDRANHVVQTRKKKREELWLQNRLGSDDGPPKVCVWVPLSPLAHPEMIEKSVLNSCATNPTAGLRGTTAAFRDFKRRLTFVTPRRDLFSVLEAAKVADLLLLALPVGGGADNAIDKVSCCLAVNKVDLQCWSWKWQPLLSHRSTRCCCRSSSCS